MMLEVWYTLNERRMDLVLKKEATGLTEEESRELENLHEVIDFYTDFYQKTYRLLESDFDRLVSKSGTN
jgi:hypothetical protein